MPAPRTRCPMSCFFWAFAGIPYIVLLTDFRGYTLSDSFGFAFSGSVPKGNHLASPRHLLSDSPGGQPGRRLLAEGSDVQKFLVFSRQRSGSTWVVQNLQFQPGLACGAATDYEHDTLSELMIGFTDRPDGFLAFGPKRRSSDVTWEEWRSAAEDSFKKVSRMQVGGTYAIGYKLMYNQIPDHLHAEFLNWISEQNIKILHLVRGSALNMVASASDTKYLHKKEGGLLDVSHDHMDKVNYTGKGPLEVDLSTVRQEVEALEELNDRWEQNMRFHQRELRYFLMYYENLLGRYKEDYFRNAVRFLSGTDGISLEQVNKMLGKDAYQRLHKPTCRDRIDNYPAVRLRLTGTITASVCDLLDAQSGA